MDDQIFPVEIPLGVEMQYNFMSVCPAVVTSMAISRSSEPQNLFSISVLKKQQQQKNKINIY